MPVFRVDVKLESFDKKYLQPIVGAFRWGMAPYEMENITIDSQESVLFMSGNMDIDEDICESVLDIALSLWWGNLGYAPLEITFRPLTRGGEAKTFVIGREDFKKVKGNISHFKSGVHGEQNAQGQ